MTADHWGFVLAAYGLAAVTLGLYWRRLCRRDRELSALAAQPIERRDDRSRLAPATGHSRSTPAPRTPLQ